MLCSCQQLIWLYYKCVVGGEDGRVSGWTSAIPSRGRNTGLPADVGGLYKQKSPVANDSQTTKDPMVSSKVLVILIFLKPISMKLPVLGHACLWFDLHQI